MLFASSEEEYRYLQDFYSRMSDGELRVLRSYYDDLTEVAQSVFRDELTQRGISRSEVHIDEQAEAEKEPTVDVDPKFYFEADLAQGGVPVCECETSEQAGLACYVLSLAGIQSIFMSYERKLDLRFPQVLVAPDNLQKAREVLAQPLSDRTRNEYEALQTVGDFQLPQCRRCSSVDVLLESVGPTNQWVCDKCGHRWKDAIAEDI